MLSTTAASPQMHDKSKAMQHSIRALCMRIPAGVCRFLIVSISDFHECLVMNSQRISVSSRTSVVTHHSLFLQRLQILQRLGVWVLQVIPGLFCLGYSLPCAL